MEKDVEGSGSARVNLPVRQSFTLAALSLARERVPNLARVVPSVGARRAERSVIGRSMTSAISGYWHQAWCCSEHGGLEPAALLLRLAGRAPLPARS
jgi:hypothetical protein